MRAWQPALALLVTLTSAACIPVGPPAPSVDPLGMPITTSQIRVEMRETYQTVDALLLGLAGGAVGTVIGGKIGYDIGYAHDIRSGCEDCGLGGLLGGAVIGFIAGTIAGGNVGMHVGAGADRNAAIARIIQRRAREQQPTQRTSRGVGPAYPLFVRALPPELRAGQ